MTPVYICLGDRVTPARWMRGFVVSHREYKKDSFVSEKIAYDLLKAIGIKEKTAFYV